MIKLTLVPQNAYLRSQKQMYVEEDLLGKLTPLEGVNIAD
jgi:hypothetical protein